MGGLVVTITFGQFADGEERSVEIRMLDGSGATALTLDRTVVFERYESCGDICVSGRETVDLRGMSDAAAESRRAVARAHRLHTRAGTRGGGVGGDRPFTGSAGSSVV